MLTECGNNKLAVAGITYLFLILLFVKTLILINKKAAVSI